MFMGRYLVKCKDSFILYLTLNLKETDHLEDLGGDGGYC
jgi:hypothetical protein